MWYCSRPPCVDMSRCSGRTKLLIGFPATFPQDVASGPSRVLEQLRTDNGIPCACSVPLRMRSQNILLWLSGFTRCVALGLPPSVSSSGQGALQL